jgi:hypothetical protein
MASRNCCKCGSTKLTWTTETFGGVDCILVYCQSCGATQGIVPKPAWG